MSVELAALEEVMADCRSAGLFALLLDLRRHHLADDLRPLLVSFLYPLAGMWR